MKYILNKEYRLRGWTDYWVCLEHFPTRRLWELTAREGHFLMKCDGVREPDEAAFAPEIRRFRNINLSITGSCDFRCRHCFNATDDSPRGITPKTDEIIEFIHRLDDCGVASLGITGGEPLLHPGLLKITQEIKNRGMVLESLNTNLYHMTEDFPDALRDQGNDPVIYTSFDGIGTHEWLRRVPGSEKRTLEQIKMLKEKGFRIHVHTCVWKDSLKSVRPTVLKLQELHADIFRITAVEPAVRWMKGSADQHIPPEEWLAFLEEFLVWWYKEKISMSLDIWGYWYHQYGSSSVFLKPVLPENDISQYRIPFCPDAYQRPYVDCDGRIMTCLGMSGVSKAHYLDWGNVYTDDLHHILRDGDFIKQLCLSVGEMKDRIPACRDCEWSKLCNFGCRAEALAQGNTAEGLDERMCIFFKKGYYGRFKRIAEEFGLEY